MTKPIAETWSWRELPILAAALRWLDSGDHLVMLEDLRAEVGLDVAQMRAGLRALEQADPPYIAVNYTMAGPSVVGGHLDMVFERGRRELGSWPSAEGVLDQLVAALDRAAELELEPERKSRLRAVADLLGGMARKIAISAIASRLGQL
jgi:hypothetical protein